LFIILSPKIVSPSHLIIWFQSPLNPMLSIFSNSSCLQTYILLVHLATPSSVRSTKHHLQEILGIRPLVSGRSSDQSTELGHLSLLDSSYHSRSIKITTQFSVDWVGKFMVFMLAPYREFISPVKTSIQIVLWCSVSYVWSFLMFYYFALTLTDGLCYVGLYTLSCVGAGVQR
jgi:hypothetical protein